MKAEYKTNMDFVVWNGNNEEDVTTLICNNKKNSIKTIFLTDKIGGVYLYHEDANGTYTTKLRVGDYIVTDGEILYITDKEDFNKKFKILPDLED